MARDLARKAAAAGVVLAAAFVAIASLGAAVFFGLHLVMPGLAAAALTALIFALIAGVVAVAFFLRDKPVDAEEDEEPVGLGGRAYLLFRERPILGTVAALAGGWIFLRNPALATMVAAAFSERSRQRRR